MVRMVIPSHKQTNKQTHIDTDMFELVSELIDFLARGFEGKTNINKCYRCLAVGLSDGIRSGRGGACFLSRYVCAFLLSKYDMFDFKDVQGSILIKGIIKSFQERYPITLTS